MTCRQLALRAILCLIGLTLCVYALPSDRMSIDDIEDRALLTSTNCDGEQGRKMEEIYPQHWHDGKWDCKDRAKYALYLLKENGYEAEWAVQRDSMKNPVHAYVRVKDGKRWISILKNPDEMKRVEDILERMRRNGK